VYLLDVWTIDVRPGPGLGLGKGSFACLPAGKAVTRGTRRGLDLLAIALAGLGCDGHAAVATGPPAASHSFSRAALLDPTACQPCHAQQVAEWLASMHAYASSDPVFLAMNARGQRETDGGLGGFCVGCHAPMAVRDGLTQDGLNLPSLPEKYDGVTCFFCHQIATVGGAQNAALVLADDLVMRGEYANPVPNPAHASTYAVVADPIQPAGAAACGACHDVVVPGSDAGIEQTYFEWAHSAFAGSDGTTCSGCHMTPSPTLQPIAQAEDAPPRTLHDHTFPAVDVALGPSAADAGEQVGAVQQALDSALQGALCVTGAGGIRVVLDPVGVGHAWPSGSAQDRRAWVEVIAYRGGAVIYQSGVVSTGQSVTAVSNDPDRWLLRECLFDAQGAPVNMFWLTASTEGNELPALATFDPQDPRFYGTHIVQRFPRDGTPLTTRPDMVTMRVRLQPVGIDVLADLVASGDLDAAVVDAMPTFDVSLTGPGGPPLEWTPEAAAGLITMSDDGTPETCVATLDFNVAAQQTLATNHTKCSP
jgi:hypothetical protein